MVSFFLKTQPQLERLTLGPFIQKERNVNKGYGGGMDDEARVSFRWTSPHSSALVQVVMLMPLEELEKLESLRILILFVNSTYGAHFITH